MDDRRPAKPKGGSLPRNAGEGRPRRGTEGPHPVSASLPAAARMMGAPKAVELAQLQGRWAEVVGPDAAAHCWPQKLEEGVLTLLADHHAWASQLQILSAAILERARSVSPSVKALAVRTSSRPGSLSW